MYGVVFVTVKDTHQAKRIAKELLKEKLIACATMIKNVESFFWWQGKVDAAREVQLILKTKKSCFTKLAKKIKLLHSYDVPEIIFLPIQKGHKAYLNWIDKTIGL